VLTTTTTKIAPADCNSFEDFDQLSQSTQNPQILPRFRALSIFFSYFEIKEDKTSCARVLASRRAYSSSFVRCGEIALTTTFWSVSKARD
jgi:hypothetical protein